VASADETTAIVAEGDTTSPDMRHIEDGLVGSAFTAEAYNETNALRAPDGIQLHVPMMICWFLYFIILLWNSITGTNSFWLMVPVTVLSWIGPGVLCLFQQPTTGDLYSTLYGLYSTIYDWHLVLFGFLPYVNCLFKVQGGPAKRIPVAIIICLVTLRSAYYLYRMRYNVVTSLLAPLVVFSGFGYITLLCRYPEEGGMPQEKLIHFGKELLKRISDLLI